MAESDESDAMSDVATKAERDFYKSRDLTSEFLMDDEGAFSDNNDPDWAEEYSSKGKRISLNADTSSDSSLELGEESKHKFKRKQKSMESEKAVKLLSKGNSIPEVSSRSSGVCTPVQKHKRRRQKKSPQMVKKGDRPRISEIGEESRDDESDYNSDDNARKFLSVLIEEDEKSDTDEIAILLSIQESLQVVAQKQETVLELLTDFVKKRHSQ